MSECGVQRKIVSWGEIVCEPEWVATLECGHEMPNKYFEHGDGMDAEAKEAAEKAGELECYKCTLEKESIDKKQAELDRLKAAYLKRTGL